MTTACKQCGQPVEPMREAWATPVCFACVPPPDPMPERAYDDGSHPIDHGDSVTPSDLPRIVR